nr:50S ribosomal protein L11 methyltransferase [Chloroflexota bacterium]
METDSEAAEAVSALFNQYNPSGAVIEEVWLGTRKSPTVRVKTFLSTEQSDVILPKIEEALWHLGQIYPIPSPATRWLSQTDWAEAWKSDYKVQRIGKRIVVKPSWLSYTATPGQIVIELDPGLAFGTGLHPSTRLSLEALEQHLQPGQQVLDVGTGSGILAIAAAKLGAGHVVALDIDDMALQVARENLARNSVQEIVSLQKASLILTSSLDGSSVLPACSASEEVESLVCLMAGPTTKEANHIPKIFNASGLWNGVFDVCVMNITADVIARSAHVMAQCLAMGGTFIVSGIIQPQEDAVCKALSAANLVVRKRRMKKDWVALIGQRPHNGSRRGRKEGKQSGTVR